MKISIVIPAYNEEKRIMPTLDQVSSFLKKEVIEYEIIVVNDGSTDKTAELVASLGDSLIRVIDFPANQGKGAAVKAGVLASQNDLTLFTDADLSTPISELKKLVNYVPRYDIVIGSRALQSSEIQVHQPVYKEILGRLGNSLIQALAAKGIKDTQCGFKLFSAKAKELFKQQRITGWGFDFEILFLARKSGLKIKEVPVIWKNDSRSKVRLKDYFLTFVELIAIRVYDIFHHYNF